MADIIMRHLGPENIFRGRFLQFIYFHKKASIPQKSKTNNLALGKTLDCTK